MTATTRPLNVFHWMDLKTRDPSGIAEFFSTVFGWRFAVDEQDWRKATRITVGGHPIGGVSDLANPVYPPGIPAHVAFYLSVDDVDHRVAVAAAHGARVVVPPFDAGDQGGVATLTDPAGAAFSLWRPHRPAGWRFPPGTTGAPHHMVLACADPDAAGRFYSAMTGAPLAGADFVAAPGPAAQAPRWELVVDVEDLAGVLARARDHGHGTVEQAATADGPVWRVGAPDGLTFRVHPLGR